MSTKTDRAKEKTDVLHKKFNVVQGCILICLGAFVLIAGCGIITGLTDSAADKQKPLEVATSTNNDAQTNKTGSIQEEKVKTEENIETPKEEAIQERIEQEPTPEPPTYEYYDVVKVVDGDTIKINYKGMTESIRFIGIDTPETVDPNQPVQCFGIEASNKAKELMQNKKVRLEFDPTQGERDKYNRLLAYVFLEDETHVNYKMIREGYAFEYTYNLPYQHMDSFKEAQRLAREEGQGLWSSETCNGGTETVNPSTPEGCDCNLTCSSIATCEDAYYQLNTCGCTGRDGDGDGIPCESTLCSSNDPEPTPEPEPTPTTQCKYDCVSPDRNCSDFSTHQEAVTFWNCCGFTATNDPMRLDGTGIDDGIPCESLP